ncbi:inaD-like protein [Anopheles darlingi]|uniref:inaD-like protein n=1 Tax=Anopheles darlingi TaxID=43151 RepID=UPI0020FFFABF|nr:inaD-like protein [Anopheles darlingi]
MGSALRTFCCRHPDKTLVPWSAATDGAHQQQEQQQQQQQQRQQPSSSSEKYREAPIDGSILQATTPTRIAHAVTTAAMFEIVMRKQHNTLGFTIRKEDESPLGYYIRSIKCEPALSDGRLRVGDRLHSVNGIPLAPLPYEQAILFIRSVTETVRLQLYRGPPPPVLATCCGPPHRTATIDHRRRLRRLRKQRSASLSESVNQPPRSGDIAATPTRLVRSNTEQNLAVTTTAENGEKEKEKEGEEEQPLPTRLPSDERLLVVRPAALPSASAVLLPLLPSGDVGYEIITVELHKGWNSRYGFSLRTEPDPMRTVISEIHSGSLASRDGRLRVGDVLLMINDEPLGTRSTAELIELLRILSGATIITVLRLHPSLLPPSTVTLVPLVQEQQQQPAGLCSLSYLHESDAREVWASSSR